MNGGLTAEENLPASERTIDPGILYNTEDPTKPHPLSPSALGSGNAQMDWAMQQAIVNAPKGQQKLTAQKTKPNIQFTKGLKFNSRQDIESSIGKIMKESWVKVPNGMTNQEATSIFKAIVNIESSFKLGQTSGAGAKGLAQIEKQTAIGIAQQSGLGLTLKKIQNDPESNIRAGIWLIFNHGWNRYRNTDNPLEFAIMDYNAGIGNIRSAQSRVKKQLEIKASNQIDKVEKLMPTETRKYIRYVRYIRHLQKQGKPIPGNFRVLALKIFPL